MTQFYQAFHRVSTASDKRWGEKDWVRGYCITTYVHKLRDETNMAGLHTLVYILSFPGHFHCQKSWQLQSNFRISSYGKTIGHAL